MPTYTSPPASASPRRKPDRPAGKSFAVDYRRPPQSPLSKAELRAMAAQAFQNTAAMKPVKKDGE